MTGLDDANGSGARSETQTLSKRLDRACDEAEHMLHFAARSQQPAPEALLDTMVTSLNDIRANPGDVTKQVAFWNAFNRLATWIRPASADSLRYCEPDGQSEDGRSGQSDADRLSRFYRQRTWFCLAILILIQIVWLAGSTTLHAARDQDAALREISEQIARIQAVKPTEKVEENPIISPLITQRDALKDQLDSTYATLKVWDRLQTWPGIIFDFIYHCAATSCWGETPSEKQNAENNRILLRVEIAVQILGLYVLPLCYGVLGAHTAVLRDLRRRRRENSIVPATDDAVNIRVALGAVAGPIIGLFFSDAESVAPLIRLSPFALAFVAGYAIDVLFEVLDQYVLRIKDAVRKGTDDARKKLNDGAATEDQSTDLDADQAVAEKAAKDAAKKEGVT